MIDVLTTVYPDLAVRMRRVYASMLCVRKMAMRSTEGLRSFAIQDEYFAQGRTVAGAIVTYAQGGESLHNFGCALDSCFVGIDPYLEKHPRANLYWHQFGDLCKAFGLVWGGDFRHHPDRPHIQLTYGLKLKDIQEIYAVGGLKGLWMQFDKIRGI